MKSLYKKILLILLLSFPSILFATCIGVGCTCSVATNTLNFGNYAPLNGSTASTSSTVSVTCSVLIVGIAVSYVIALNSGSSGSFATRTMKLSSSNLNYNIYTDSPHTTIWGDGTAGTSTISDSYNLSLSSSVTRNYTMYGLIPASQNVPIGTYSDTVVVTVTY